LPAIEIFLAKEKYMKSKIILLVEDNPDDEALALRALKKSKIETNVMQYAMELRH